MALVSLWPKLTTQHPIGPESDPLVKGYVFLCYSIVNNSYSLLSFLSQETLEMEP